jgi:hypothetical protein
MIDEPLLVRTAECGDIDDIAGLFQRVYQQTSHPCASRYNLAAGFARGERWLVCVHRDAIVACTGLVPHRWNATYEGGRSVTLPAYTLS